MAHRRRHFHQKISTDDYLGLVLVEPLDFFGGGRRIALIVVSNYSGGGKVVHSYNDHASVVNFIERNWGLKPLIARSRDNLPNPDMDPNHPYAPLNMPAVGDLFDMFNFGGNQQGNQNEQAKQNQQGNQ